MSIENFNVCISVENGKCVGCNLIDVSNGCILKVPGQAIIIKNKLDANFLENCPLNKYKTVEFDYDNFIKETKKWKKDSKCFDYYNEIVCDVIEKLQEIVCDNINFNDKP